MRENKNNTVLKHIAAITSQNKMDVMAVMFSRVGHTHGSLGALAAIMSYHMMISLCVKYVCLLHSVTKTSYLVFLQLL